VTVPTNDARMPGANEPAAIDATTGARLPIGVLVIRVWRESAGNDPHEQLRARLMGRLDVEHGPDAPPQYAVGIESIIGRVGAWLETFERSLEQAPPSADMRLAPREER